MLAPDLLQIAELSPPWWESRFFEDITPPAHSSSLATASQGTPVRISPASCGSSLLFRHSCLLPFFRLSRVYFLVR